MLKFQEFKTSEKVDILGITRLRFNFPNGYTASVIKGAILHCFPFAWEVAVLKDGVIDYTTPLTTNVEVFENDDETNEFLEKIKNL